MKCKDYKSKVFHSSIVDWCEVLKDLEHNCIFKQSS